MIWNVGAARGLPGEQTIRVADPRAIPSQHRNSPGLLTSRLRISLVSPDRNPYKVAGGYSVKIFTCDLRLDPETLAEIRREARRSARPASQIIHMTLKEGLRLRRCPGIVFTDGPAGRRATIAGSGIDVWEVIRVYRAAGEDLEDLRKALPHLSLPQLEAALHYHKLYPDEIGERLNIEERSAQELLGHPWMRKMSV